MTAFQWRDCDAEGIAELRPASASLSEETNARAYAAAVWSCLAEPGDAVAGALIAALGPDEALREVVAGERGAVAADAAGMTAGELGAGVRRWRPRLDAESIAFAIGLASRNGITLVTRDDDCWPTGLDDLGPHAPVCLWVAGRAESLTRLDPAIALVGARAASAYGEYIAAEFAADLAGRGIPVVSGAAYGIDGAAHRAALTAEGKTVALLAGGVDRPYPAGHADLLRRIAGTGAVASEVPCGSAPTRWRFLQRNRLIAALGTATVVVEAGWRSGSLNTAGHAAMLGRPLGAVPGPVTSGSSAGCHRLLREYDARCVTTADEVAELMGLPTGTRTPDASDAPRTTERTRVADALSVRSWRTVDDVAKRSGMSPEHVRAHLGMMALEGAAQADGTRWRRVIPAGVP